MNGWRRMRVVGLLLGLGVLLFALGYVEYRHRNPQWKTYQERGIALAIERLEAELSSAASQDRRSAILSELQSLRNRKPQIIEIKPFGQKDSQPDRCITCHYGIEDLSASHPNSVFGCVVCHGGNGADLTVKGAHLGMRGGRNPARLDLASLSCGSTQPGGGTCHGNREHPLLNRVDTVPRSIMATNAGIIGILRFQWGLDDRPEARYGIRPVTDGKTSLEEIPAERPHPDTVNLANSHFRKFCATCHLWTPRHREAMGRLEGCPACHAPYEEGGRYTGADPTINRSETGHPATHTITNLIPDDRCRACHNRSARIGLNYHGEMESAQYGTPFVRGGLNEQTLSDGRFVLHLAPDIHREKGMGCIDCHTGQDTMGDGVVHGEMKDQIEIRCEDCHGGCREPPRTRKVDKNDPLAQALIRSSKFVKPQDGETIIETSKGRPLPHVRLKGETFVLTSKLTGKEHPVRIITGKRNGHTIKGHERMECDSCHSAWSPQCYGCHQVLDFGHMGRDHLSGNDTPGRWAEGRTYFRFERNIFGINSRGNVGILVPGCQVWNTVRDSTGRVIQPYDSAIMRLKNGLNSIAMGPIHPHTSRLEVPRCVDCHLDPKALGLGDGELSAGPDGTTLEASSLYDSVGSGLKIPFSIDAVIDVNGRILQGTSHALSRGFNKKELDKILGIARCLPCHDRYDDPIWEKPGPYVEAAPCKRKQEEAAGSLGLSETGG